MFQFQRQSCSSDKRFYSAKRLLQYRQSSSSDKQNRKKCYSSVKTFLRNKTFLKVQSLPVPVTNVSTVQNVCSSIDNDTFLSAKRLLKFCDKRFYSAFKNSRLTNLATNQIATNLTPLRRHSSSITPLQKIHHHHGCHTHNPRTSHLPQRQEVGQHLCLQLHSGSRKSDGRSESRR